jgi:hypothetical protein
MFSDTLWVVNTLSPGTFHLGSSAKRGPNKSPDFIAQDVHGNISVLECKGTQTSQRSLFEAIERGIPQKGNLYAIGSTQIQHSLVAGIFVPQFENTDGALLVLADPDWQELKKSLSQFSPEAVGRGVTQVAYAKELALLDLSETANSLARAKGTPEDITDAFSLDAEKMSPGRSIKDDQVRMQREYLWPKPRKLADDLLISGVRFEASLPVEDVERLRRVVSPSEHGEAKRDASKNADWKVTSIEETVEMRSPLGTTLRLCLLEA